MVRLCEVMVRSLVRMMYAMQYTCAEMRNSSPLTVFHQHHHIFQLLPPLPSPHLSVILI